VLLGDEGPQDRTGDVGMIEGAERVADVVQERAYDVFLVLSRAVRESGGLQRGGQGIDGEGAVEQAEVGEEAIRQFLRERNEARSDDRPVVDGRSLHRGEGRARFVLMHPVILPFGAPSIKRLTRAVMNPAGSIGASGGRSSLLSGWTTPNRVCEKPAR